VTRNNWLVHNNLGVLLFNEGERDSARRHFLEALRLQPNYAHAHYNLGRLLAREGRPEEAIVHFERALALDPNHAPSHFDLAALLEQQGRWAEARAHFEQATLLRPGWPLAGERLARLLIDSGDLAGAAAQLEKLARSAPSNAEYAFLAGMVHEARGDSVAAGRWYARAAELPGADAAMRDRARKYVGDGFRPDAPAAR
jgi:Flp pilus assembly protein TadD